MAFARATRVCSPEDSTPHFTFRNFSRSNWANQSMDPLRQTLGPAEQAEDTEILLHRQIPWERSINGCEIRAPQRLGAACRKSHPIDMD